MISKTPPSLELKFSHNIIEHLGLKLYQNKPSNVIAELLSNSWDADAENINIILNQESENQSEHTIAILDDGHGMDYETLATHYLIIGKHKRSKQDLTATSPKERKFMGRKGIGKLAPFGISRKITVVTRHKTKDDSLINWFTLDMSELLKTEEDDSHDALQHTYTPEIIESNIAMSALSPESRNNGVFKKFFDFSDTSNSGTLILLQDLSLKRKIPEQQLIESLGRRFTITLLRNDFSVKINGKALSEKEALPSFDLRIPESGAITETINCAGIDREVKHWVGFVDITKSDWPQDQAGVGVYAHGKIAQDRPYFFGIKGREIFTRYMYGVIEADWIDEFPDDVVSTDRTSVDWEHEGLIDLKKIGHNLVGKWITTYKNSSKEGREDRVNKTLNSIIDIPKISSSEREAIVKMVANLGPQIDKNPNLQVKILTNMTSAWTHKPIRQLIKGLWDNIDTSISNEELILGTIGKLNDYLVPESLSVAVMISQRIYAISKLYQLKLAGNENQLQYLIEEFPWILSPDMAQLTANESMTTVLNEAIKKELVPSNRHMTSRLKEDANLRPDFVLFSNASETSIKIVELKSPEISLDRWHRQQLIGYIDYFEENYPKSNIKGWLIGKNPNDLEHRDERIVIYTWDDIFQKSRKDHLHLLAAMLNGAREYADDSRLIDSIEFAGTETMELLKKITQVDSDFSEVFNRIEKKLSALGKTI